MRLPSDAPSFLLFLAALESVGKLVLTITPMLRFLLSRAECIVGLSLSDDKRVPDRVE
jgi:hypothetical protein